MGYYKTISTRWDSIGTYEDEERYDRKQCTIDRGEAQRAPGRITCAGFGARQCDASECDTSGTLWYSTSNAFGDKYCREHKHLLGVIA